MVVCLILKVDQPLFVHTVNIHRNNDGAGIDLIGFFLIFQFAFFFELFRAQKSQIHQADKFVRTAFVQLVTVSQIFLECTFNDVTIISLAKSNILQLCGEGGMTAVIRPVGIQYTDLCHGRITFFFVLKIILNMQEILEGHGQSQRIIQFFQLCFRHILKTVKDLYICRLIKFLYQSFRFFDTCLAGIHRVDAVILDCCVFFLCNIAFDNISNSGTDHRLCASVQELHTLYGRIGTLVKLSRQKLYREYSCSVCYRQFFMIQSIYRRLSEHTLAGLLKYLVGQILHIVADQLTDTGHGCDSEIAADLMFQLMCLTGKIRFFLNIDTSYCTHYASSCK